MNENRDPTVEIRAVQGPDHDAWLPLWHGYLTFYEAELPAAVSALTWRRLLDPAEPVHGAVALVDTRPVGFTHWVMHRSTWNEEPACYLEDLFVTPEARGHGLGAALIRHVAAETKHQGYGSN